MLGMVVCAEPSAAQVGLSILRRGNAVDAAIAARLRRGCQQPDHVRHRRQRHDGDPSGFNPASRSPLISGESAARGAISARWRRVISARRVPALAIAFAGGPTSSVTRVVGTRLRARHPLLARFGSGKLSWGDLLEARPSESLVMGSRCTPTSSAPGSGSGIRWPGYPRTVAGLSRRSGDLHRRRRPLGSRAGGSSSPIWPARWSGSGVTAWTSSTRDRSPS